MPPEGKARGQRGLADGRAAGRTNPAKELNEKDRSIRPLGRAKGRGPRLRFGFRNAIFPSLFRRGGG
jgi:hypothetical protein